MNWRITKRDGRVEEFDADKIKGALRKCFVNGLGKGIEESEPTISAVAEQAVNLLVAQGKSSPTVEEVQQAVITQLWAMGHCEAAEHYTIYRDEKRQRRESVTISSDVVRAVREDAERFSSPLQYFQFIDKYARWREEDRRRETWAECCDRVIGFFRSREQLQVVTEGEWNYLRGQMYNLQSSPAMRIVQMAGPTLERCNTGAYNCSYLAVDSLASFYETLYLLMQGCGVGFSVESDYVDCLPRVKKQRGKTPHQFRIEDSTEGWCDAYRFGLETWFTGDDVEFDYSSIRPAGSRLRTKGGRASGPEPLRRLLTFARTIILERQGKRLSTRDCHDLMCVTGKIVQVGGVRRSSEISLSDLDDVEMRDAKSGNWWDSAPWLDMANNSAVYAEKPDAITFMEEWLAIARSGSGERGIFNRAGILKQIPRRRKKARFGGNPCLEIYLRSLQFCNLSIAVARADDTPSTLRDKVIAATIFGTIQSTLTDFKYIRDVWRQNCEEERLLGVDITGQIDCPILRPGAPGRAKLLESLKEEAIRTNLEWANRLGIPQSAAITCVKPSGNSAAFFGCSSGLHARWSRYQVRRVRVGKDSPVAKLLASEGVPNAVDPLNDSLLVFDFLPDPAPPGTPTRNDMTAVEQFRNWLEWKIHWTEHNPSATIYVGPEEWLALGHEVYENFDRIGGISVLPKDGGNYMLAPNEELTEEEYFKRRGEFPSINWAKLAYFESEDTTDQRVEPACAGGVCER